MMHNKHYEREFADMMINKGYHCERVAGSGRAKASVCDCVLFAKGRVYLVEVKATKEEKLYLRGGIQEQLRVLRETAQKQEVLPLLAIKFKYRGWNTYIVPETHAPLSFQGEMVL